MTDLVRLGLAVDWLQVENLLDLLQRECLVASFLAHFPEPMSLDEVHEVPEGNILQVALPQPFE